ncbi:MAG: glucosaminidase domain-containing protein [Spirochaetaceae bacterium]|jgi:hypothetical protein|nr:glucosaminidase domain-containing protein [Spirochaetaceae bacterium]
MQEIIRLSDMWCKSWIKLITVAVLVSACASNQTFFPIESKISPSEIERNFRDNKQREWENSKQALNIPPSPENILGDGKTNCKELAGFLREINPFIKDKFAEDFAKIYVEEAAIEGINHDVAFSQMCLETGFLSFGGLVTPEMNNYCGLGSISADETGIHFPSPRIGIRAQIQHLKVYATDKPLNQKSVDPRGKFVRPGSAQTIYQLAGLWAEDKEYGRKLKVILDKLYLFSFGH